MIDQAYRDRLREALDTKLHMPFIILAAARLVASETTLIVEKVNGEWPDWAIKIVHHWDTTSPVLDALLAHQTGTTE